MFIILFNMKVVNKINKKIDMVGQKYGKLTVLEMIYDEKSKRYRNCKCLCECGNEVIKEAYKLRNIKTEHIPSCGCDMAEYKREKYTNHIVGNRYNRLLVLEEIWCYPEDQNKLKCICDCGKIVIVKRKDVLSGHTQSCGCLHRDIIIEANRVDDSGYISDYGVKIIKPFGADLKNQTIWECNCVCGKKFYDIAARIKNGHVRSCGCLKKSSMETYIQKFLDSNNIQYITQHTYKDCVSEKGNRLRFDFAIIKDSKVFYLIEYDGRQHFEPVECFGGKESYDKQVANDKIKDEYCKNNNIPLLRLPYYLTNEEIRNKIMNIMNA